LIGTLIGGFITYITTSTTENRKWKRERMSKLQEQQREAIGRALDWMVPITSALIRVESLTSAFQSSAVDENHFRREYPDLVSSLAKMDPPPHLVVMLPKNTYARGNDIIMRFEKLRALNMMRDSPRECFDMVSILRAKIDELRDYLEQEYLKTFT